MSRSSPTLPIEAPPQYGTRRRPERPTLGGAVEGVAGLLGRSLRPWQRQFADVFCELVPDPDDSARLVFAYSDGSLSVGRRAGKSFLLFVLGCRSMLAAPRTGVRFTAQDRTSAVMQLREEWLPTLDGRPLNDAIVARFTNGSEGLATPHNHSFIKLFAPTPTALHGSESSLVMLDEGFAHSRERGAELTIAVRPTLLTTRGQLLWSSAAGDLDSTWWADTLDAGRAAAELDRGLGLCHSEWTIDGTDLDPDDPATWRLVHPGGLPLDVLAASHAANRPQFLRTILNMTDRAGSAGSPIDVLKWRELAAQGELNRQTAMTLGVDVGPDQATATIAACTDDGRAVEIIAHGPGADWVPDAVARLVDRYEIVTVAYEPGGPAGVLVDRFAGLGIPTTEKPLRAAAGALASFASLVATGNVRYRPDVSLDLAVEGARRRAVGDGAWHVSRRNSTADVTALIAVAFAVSVHPEAFTSLAPEIT